MPNSIIFDGHDHREMTDAEYVEWQTLCTELKAQKNAVAQAEAEKKATRAAALVKLGLTADEVAALFG